MSVALPENKVNSQQCPVHQGHSHYFHFQPQVCDLQIWQQPHKVCMGMVVVGESVTVENHEEAGETVQNTCMCVACLSSNPDTSYDPFNIDKSDPREQSQEQALSIPGMAQTPLRERQTETETDYK